MTNIQRFSDEIVQLQKIEDPTDECNGQRELHDEEVVAELQIEFPSLPKDYWIYLMEIGWGSFYDGMFSIFSAPLTLDDLGLSEVFEIETPEKFVFFGSDISGDLAGFDRTSPEDKVIELWHEDSKIESTNLSFKNYVRHQIGLRSINGQK